MLDRYDRYFSTSLNKRNVRPETKGSIAVGLVQTPDRFQERAAPSDHTAVLIHHDHPSRLLWLSIRKIDVVVVVTVRKENSLISLTDDYFLFFFILLSSERFFFDRTDKHKTKERVNKHESISFSFSLLRRCFHWLSRVQFVWCGRQISFGTLGWSCQTVDPCSDCIQSRSKPWIRVGGELELSIAPHHHLYE